MNEAGVREARVYAMALIECPINLMGVKPYRSCRVRTS